jgi:hypothetical protein
MVIWGGLGLGPGNEGQRADWLAVQKAPLSSTLSGFRPPLAGHFLSLLSPSSEGSLSSTCPGLDRWKQNQPNRPRGRGAGQLQEVGRTNPRRDMTTRWKALSLLLQTSLGVISVLPFPSPVPAVPNLHSKP